MKFDHELNRRGKRLIDCELDSVNIESFTYEVALQIAEDFLLSLLYFWFHGGNFCCWGDVLYQA